MKNTTKSVRIHVYLSRLGFASRREAERWVKDGKVIINNRPAVLGQLVEPEKDLIRVKGKKLVFKSTPKEAVVIALNKPKGVITSVKDPHGRDTVLGLLPPKPRLFPIGRLDLNSEGLLLLTNDGDLAHRLMHPKFEVPKIYEVKIRGHFDDRKIKHIEKGVLIGAEKFKGAEVLECRNATRSGLDKYVVKIRVYEGKNHHVRRLFMALKCRVVKLKRVAFGPISVKGIPTGEYRKLSRVQIQRLRDASGMEKAS